MSLHSERYAVIKPFVSFKFTPKQLENLSNYNKRLIKQYFDAVIPNLNGVFKIYRPRTAENLKAALAYAGMSPPAKYWRAAVLQGVPEGAAVSVKNGKLSWTFNGKRSNFEKIDIKAFIRDPRAEAKRIVESLKKADYYRIVTKVTELGQQSRSGEILADNFEQFNIMYGDPRRNNYVGNWMTGVVARVFPAKTESERLQMTKVFNEARKKAANKKKAAAAKRAKRRVRDAKKKR
jgi:hypothetical protein